MDDLLEDLNNLEKNIQKLSVVDKEKYNYFHEKIQTLKSSLVNLDDSNYDKRQMELSKIIDGVVKLKLEFSNYMKTGNLKATSGGLFFELESEKDNNQSGNEKVKKYRLGLLNSTVELVRKNVEVDFDKIEQIITKFNAEKNNVDHEYSVADIAYLDELIAELFIEYQRKYYQRNGNLPPEEPAEYCNADAYEGKFRSMVSEKLIEERERLSKIEGLVLDDKLGQAVKDNEIWTMLTNRTNQSKMQTTELSSEKQEEKNVSTQLVVAKKKNKRLNNKVIVTIRKKDIFGNLVEKTKKIRLDDNGEIVIPKEIKKDLLRVVLPDGMTQVSSSAFSGCINLAEAFIPEGVKVIREYAFQNCQNLEEIVLPCSMIGLRNDCFANSGLRSIKIPKNVQNIGDYSFMNCVNLKDVILSEGLKRIGNWAFCNSSVETMLIPDSVKSIGQGALECPYLEEISIPETLSKDEMCGDCSPEIIIRKDNNEVSFSQDINKKNDIKQTRTVEEERE